jgi:TrmH family RNA methyltransferase
VRSVERAFVAEGLKVVEAAFEAGASVESLYVAPEGAGQASVEALVRRALDAGTRVFDLGPGVMEKVADTVTPQPVCAVVADVRVPLEELARGGRAGEGLGQPGGGRLLLVCAGVRDPGNLGALVRSAAAAGAAGVVCCEGTADPLNPKTVRASAGAVFTLPIAPGGPLADAVRTLRAAGFRAIGTVVRDGVDYASADLSGDLAVVLGNEASGLSEEVLADLDERVTVPMVRGTESLNVAMTATVLCFEVARRRRLP